MVDFTKKLTKNSSEKPLDPQVIYEKLDRASDKGPLRPSQITVLDEWYTNLRSEKDLVFKMHTGQGKTLAGLLMLQSKLNEYEEPVVYLCPNKYLVEQTLAQAKQFGIHCVNIDSELPDEFTNGQAVLVTHIQKLFNGKTLFQLGAQSQRVSTILMDDAHSCIEAIKETFTIKLPSSHQAYSRIISLFDDELRQQGIGTFAEIKQGKRDSLLAIPYWAWAEKKEDVVSIFSEYLDETAIKFTWSLLKDIFDKCLCVITGNELEIFPYAPPLHFFGTYTQAKHRIFMSATVTNDAFLIKGLGVSEKAILHPLVDRNEKWSGEKMILTPSLMDSSLSDSFIVQSFGKSNPKRNVGFVVLTPSFKGSERWEDAGAKKIDKENIYKVIEQLKQGDCKDTIIIANRYDGIDLPDNACRILIIDSVPIAQGLIERYIEERRDGSEIQEMVAARKIEQGLGRAVRGDKDYCVVILLGSGLIKKVKSKNSKKYFSPQTRKQIEIGLQVTAWTQEEAQAGSAYDALRKIINQCLQRDQGWKDFYEQEMSELPEAIDNSSVLKIFSAEAMAERKYSEGKYDEAVGIIQKLIDEAIASPYEKGWYLQEMARYVFPQSKAKSNEYQVIAHKNNHFLFKPRQGMVFSKIEAIGQKRAEAIIRFIQKFDSFDELSIFTDELLNQLVFGIDSDIFERSINNLAEALGFQGQRPDKEMGAGPDNLWALQETQYLLIECKNEVISQRSNIYKTETGQMSNSIAWFRQKYNGASVKCLMVHPVKKLGQGAGFNEPVEIMRERELNQLKQNVRTFFNEFKGLEFADLSESKIQELLNIHKLSVDEISSNYSVSAVQSD
jgi:replicative superfamily II helicase